MNMEWTLVQRKTRPRRGHDEGFGDFPSWNRAERGEDRARVPWGGFSPGGRTFTYPNFQPVPPREPTGSGGRRPYPKTFAQVVQGGRPNGNHTNLNRDLQHRKKPKYIQPDQHFKGMIHKFHLLIKVIHHGENVSSPENGHQPKIIQHMVKLLSNLIKPAMPNQNTRDYINGNARQWGHTTVQILQQHYDEQVANLQSQIEEYDMDEWEAPFKVAVGWSVKKLPRLQEATIEKARQIIIAAVSDRYSHTPSDSDPDLSRDLSQNLESPGAQLQESLDPIGPEPPEAMDTPGPQPLAAEDFPVLENRNNTKKTTRPQSPKKTNQQGKTIQHEKTIQQGKTPQKNNSTQHDPTITRVTSRPNRVTQEPIKNTVTNNTPTCETNPRNMNTLTCETNGGKTTQDNREKLSRMTAREIADSMREASKTRKYKWLLH